MVRFFLVPLFSTCLALLPASAGEKGKKDRIFEFDGDTQENFDKNIKPLLAGVAKSKKLGLYEGLPHQFYEKDLLEKELKDKRSVKLHDFPFYQVPITPKDADVKALSALCSSTKTFGRYKGLRRCGGFHPDWCVELKDEERVYRVLICFGCQEARIYGPKNELWVDLDEKARNEFSKLLVPYWKSRPERKKGN